MCVFQYQSALKWSLGFVQPEASVPKPLSPGALWQPPERSCGRRIVCMGTVSCRFRSCNLGRSISFRWATIPLYFSIQAFCSQATTDTPSFCCHDDRQGVARVAGEVCSAALHPLSLACDAMKVPDCFT